MAFSQDVYSAALTFAATAHGAQKTPFGLPYVVHVSLVAMEVAAALRAEPGHDEDLAIACALLHDVVEDTAVRLDDIRSQFGQHVAAGVDALTKNPTLHETRAIRDSLDRILTQPPEVAMVKLADRITNLAPPPPYWSAAKTANYHEQAQLIVDTLGHVSSGLAKRFRERLGRYPGGTSTSVGA